MACPIEEMILANTTVCSPSLCPELVLHLLRPDAVIWVGTPETPDPPTPFWGIAWGAGQAMARWILDHRDIVRNRHVLELGAGSGIVSMAAALAGAAVVTAVDSDPASVKAVAMNADKNGVEIRTMHATIHSVMPDEEHVVLASDVGYPGANVVGYLRQLAASGRLVLIAEPDRRGADLSADEILATYDIRAEPATEAFNIRRAFVARLQAAPRQ